MSRSAKVLELVRRYHPSAVLCGPYLLFGETGYIVRGLLLDTTSYKDHMRLYKVVTPIHRPLESIILSYSDDITGGGYIHVDRSNYEAAARTVLERVGSQLTRLQELRLPHHFLDHIAYMSGNSNVNVRLDFGLTHYLVGNVELARRIFCNLAADLDGTKDRLGPLVGHVLNLLEADPHLLLNEIDKWRAENIDRLGIAAACRRRAENIASL